MTPQRIEYLRTENNAERLSYGELIEIQSAFEQIHPSKLSDDPANAVASDMLNEIEANLPTRNENAMTVTDLIGTEVIMAGSDSTYIYEGPANSPGWNRITLNMGGGPMKAQADFDAVAPATVEISTKDERVTTVKHEKKPYPHANGVWQLKINDISYGFFKTKKAATAEGLHRLAIMDWHASNEVAGNE